MNSMKDVYNKLKNAFKKIDIIYNEESNTIDIINGKYIISANDKMVELSKSFSYVNHKVNKDYKEVYKTIERYIKDPNGYIKSKRIQIIVVLIISLLLTFIIGLILGI